MVQLENILQFLDNEGLEAIIHGDTYCNFGPVNESEYDAHAKHLSEIYKIFGFKQLINKPTRETLSTATIIDHVATTACRNIVASGVVPISLSDHYLIFCRMLFSVLGNSELMFKKNTKTFSLGK